MIYKYAHNKFNGFKQYLDNNYIITRYEVQSLVRICTNRSQKRYCISPLDGH